MIAQRSNSHVFPALCARANASVRRISSLYVFSAHLLFALRQLVAVSRQLKYRLVVS